MIDDRHFHIDLDPKGVTLSLIAAQLVSAFYAALLLKKSSGADLTAEIEKSVWDEMLERWTRVDAGVCEGLKGLTAQPGHQGTPGRKR